MKIQRLFFGDSVRAVGEAIAVQILDHRDLLQPAIDFVCGGEDDSRPVTRQPRRLQHIQRAESVYVEIRPRFGNRCRNRHLASEVVDYIRIADGDLNRVEIPHVRVDDAEPKIPQMALKSGDVVSSAWPQQRVEDSDGMPRREQIAHQIEADKPCTAYDERTDTHVIPLATAFPQIEVLHF
jgi:hypothetical protein